MTLSSVLYGISKHHIISRLRIYEAVSNLLLSIILVYPFGIVGVALGTAVPQLLFMGLILPLLVSKAVKFPIGRYIYEAYFRPFAAVIPFYACYLGLSTYLYPDNLAIFFLEIFVSMPVYAISVYFICMGETEREKTLAVAKRIGVKILRGG